ncbi:MAG: P-type conjugative transfer protein TrbJ [Proteobacteria bacterium]|nr:MAG: P-type conjugative transfer protein TrbJ [Pseudomonadota bacterium]
MKTKLIVYLSLCLSPTILLAGSVAGTGGSTEVTQILNNIQLVEQGNEMVTQTRKLANQLEKQAAMVNDMKTQAKALSNQEWSRTSSQLQQLANISRQGEAIAYSSANIDALYRQKYKGYNAYSQEKTGSSFTYSDRYSEWSNTNRDSTVSAMKSANLQQSQFADETATMQTIEIMGRSAQGRMQAIQVGNQIAAQQVGQVQKLRSLVMAQMQMQAAHQAFEANQKDSANAKSRNFFKNDASNINVSDGQKF